MKRTNYKGVRPPKNYVSYFNLCQAIAGQFEDAAKRIGTAGIHAPVMHTHIVTDLQCMKALCDRAIAAVNAAQEEWK